MKKLVEKNNNTSKNVWERVNKICEKTKVETKIERIKLLKIMW